MNHPQTILNIHWQTTFWTTLKLNIFTIKPTCKDPAKLLTNYFSSPQLSDRKRVFFRLRWVFYESIFYRNRWIWFECLYHQRPIQKPIKNLRCSFLWKLWNGLRALAVLSKSFFLNVWMGSEYVSTSPYLHSCYHPSIIWKSVKQDFSRDLFSQYGIIFSPSFSHLSFSFLVFYP